VPQAIPSPSAARQSAPPFRRVGLMETINARSIFSPATGFIKRGGFDWTCNPYVGCSFG
jgi:hypothetical protein